MVVLCARLPHALSHPTTRQLITGLAVVDGLFLALMAWLNFWFKDSSSV